MNDSSRQATIISDEIQNQQFDTKQEALFLQIWETLKTLTDQEVSIFYITIRKTKEMRQQI